MSSLAELMAASVIAFILAASMLLDGPTELDATRDVAAEVHALTGGGK